MISNLLFSHLSCEQFLVELGLLCIDGRVVLEIQCISSLSNAPLHRFSHGAKLLCFECGRYKQKLQSMYIVLPQRGVDFDGAWI